MDRTAVDILSIPLYAGIAGIELPFDEIDLGDGVFLRRTYAHIMAPYLAAFSKPSPGKHHPAPWKTVAGGTAFDILAELAVPLEFSPSPYLDRLSSIWWFVALIRIAGSPLARVPVIASHPYGSIATIEGDPTFWPVELETQTLIAGMHRRPIEPATIEWIKKNWRPGGALMAENDGFNVAFQALDESLRQRSYSVALVTLWGALERIFSPAHQELTFRISANIASYLEPAGETRFALYNAIKRLYGARSKAAHGAGGDDRQAFVETYMLLKRSLLKMLENRHVPTRDELESLMFS